MALKFLQKLQRKWMKVRLQPIRVFCLHHVCEQFNAEAMHLCDWMAFDEFKQKIIVLRSQGYQFISLADAYNHLKKDYFRRKKYAVFTFDDGYMSLKEVLPWLEAQLIPVTLFINGKYLDGKSYRETAKEQYLTHDELFSLTSPLLEISHHGWEHKSVEEMSEAELIDSMQKNIEILSAHPRYIPFWAYTYGIHNQNSDVTLSNNGMNLVLVNGGKNYNWIGAIDRELL